MTITPGDQEKLVTEREKTSAQFLADTAICAGNIAEAQQSILVGDLISIQGAIVEMERVSTRAHLAQLAARDLAHIVKAIEDAEDDK